MVAIPAGGFSIAPRPTYPSSLLPLGGQSAKPTPKPVDPFAQVNVHQQIRSLIGTMPPPLTPAQVTARTAGMLDPVVAQITQAIQARAKAGMDTVGGYANSLADSLAQSGEQNVRNAYAPAEAGTAAANSALADRISGAGNTNSDALAARLASINEPGATDPAVAALRTAATGAGNASYAVGNASLEQMLAEHGAASAYANKLPDIARLTGIQQGENVQGTANSDLASQLGPIYAQVPTLVENMRNAQDTKQSNYQSRADSLYTTLTGQNTTRAVAKAGLAKTSQPDATLSSRLGYLVDSTGRAIPNAKGEGQLLPGFKWNAAGTGTEKVAKASKPAAAPKVSTPLSAANKYLTDTSGQPVLQGGKKVPYTPYVKPGAAKSGGKSDSEKRQEYDSLVAIETTAQGQTVLGKKVGGDTFQKAYSKGISYLTGLGYNSADARRLALKAMGAAGWGVPGQVDVSP